MADGMQNLQPHSGKRVIKKIKETSKGEIAKDETVEILWTLLFLYSVLSPCNPDQISSP